MLILVFEIANLRVVGCEKTIRTIKKDYSHYKKTPFAQCE